MKNIRSTVVLAAILAVMSLLCASTAFGARRPTIFRDMAAKLSEYRKQRDELKKLLPEVKDVYNQRFFAFGMGQRTKFYYENRALRNATTGEVIRKWEVDRDIIVPSEYAVVIMDMDGLETVIREDSEGIWMEDVLSGTRQALSSEPVKLPTFDDHKFGLVLRVLHQEILVNILAGGEPTPNLFAYKNAWYRDAAMTCMALEKTGNIMQVKDWILRLKEPFDKNNGVEEPDNLGQVLYMVSLVSDSTHRVVKKVREAAARYTVDKHIEGPTDGSPKPVYQTKWMKFGLKCLGMDDPYEIPQVADPYADLVWWAYLPEGGAKGQSTPNHDYPYLGWAQAHYYRDTAGALFNKEDSPLTWEINASKADYDGMGVVASKYKDTKTCAPHSWQAAEMFLYILDVLK